MNAIVYAIEAICLGIFMVVATLATTAFELPTSPLHQAITDPLLKNIPLGRLGQPQDVAAIPAMDFPVW